MNRFTILLLSLTCIGFNAHANPDEIKKGQQRYNQNCASCHGASGEGRGIFPKISGANADTIEQQLNLYRNYKQVGKLSSLMYVHVSSLTDQETRQLSEYIATLK